MAEDTYVCTLDEASLKKAKEELHEDPEQRMSQVEALRKYVTEQPHLESPTDTEFLLLFLRQGKFSQLRARKTLEGWLKMKTDIPKWFDNVDLLHPNAIKFLKTGYFLSIPKRDPEGRHIVITRAGCFEPDSKLYDRDVIIRTLFALFFNVERDENTMVNGLVNLFDMTGMTLKHQLFWGMDNIKKMTTCWQKNMPGRFKAFHMYKINPVIETFLAMFLPLFSSKFQSRVILHGNNMENVYKHIPFENLPREYLPDDYDGPHAGTIDELTENLLCDLRSPELLKRVERETDVKVGFDKSKKLEDLANESFRQLKVD